MKPIPNFPDYQITKAGRVWSNPKKTSSGTGLQHRGKWLKPYINRCGYLCIGIYKNSKQYQQFVHRLVLETYIEPRPDGMECHHINGIKTDNRIENLIWTTKSKNILDAVKRRVHPSARQNGEKNPIAKFLESQVRVIRYLYKVAKFSVADLAWQFDVSHGAIYAICKGTTWKHLNA